MEEVLRRTSLVYFASPCFVLCLMGLETEGLLDYQKGRTGIISIVRGSLRPVIFAVHESALCCSFTGDCYRSSKWHYRQ